MGSVAACRRSVAVAHSLIDDSRRGLSDFRERDLNKPAPTPSRTMTCLLCGSEAPQIYHLKFEARIKRNFDERYPTIDLNQRLRGFGVCPDCMLLYGGRRRRVIFALNRKLREVNEPRLHRFH
jgi:hypothetical protein